MIRLILVFLFFVAVFLGCTSTGRVGLCFLWFFVQEIPKARFLSNHLLVLVNIHIWTICTIYSWFSLNSFCMTLGSMYQDGVRGQNSGHRKIFFLFFHRICLLFNIKYYLGLSFSVWPWTFGFITQNGARGQNLGHLQSVIQIFWIMQISDQKVS